MSRNVMRRTFLKAGIPPRPPLRESRKSEGQVWQNIILNPRCTCRVVG